MPRKIRLVLLEADFERNQRKRSFDNTRMSRFLCFNDTAVIFQFKLTFHFTLANVIFCAVTHCDRTLDHLQDGKS